MNTSTSCLKTGLRRTSKFIKVMLILFALLHISNNSFLFGQFGGVKVSHKPAEEKFGPSDVPYEPKGVEPRLKLPAKLMASSTKAKSKIEIKKIAATRVRLINNVFQNLAPEAKENINHIISDFSKISTILLCWKNKEKPAPIKLIKKIIKNPT